jgi:nucleoside phosphorylase
MTGYDIDSLISSVRSSTNKQGLIWELDRLRHYLERNAILDIRNQSIKLISQAINLLNSDKMLFLLQNDIIAVLEDLKGLIDESNSLDPILSLCDAVIVTVTDVEYNAFHKIEKCNWVECQFNDSIIAVNLSGSKPMQAVINGIKIVLIKQLQMGMVEAAVITEKAITCLRPKAIINSGIAASIRPNDVKMNDVVVVNECWDYGNGELEGSSIDTDHFFHTASHAISSGIIRIIIDKEQEINRKLIDWRNKFFHSAFNRENIKMHIGKMVSGAAVIKNETVKDIIRKESRDVLALDMETYGFYYVLQRRNNNNRIPIDYITIKSIVDYADSQKKDENHELASYLSAQTTLFVIDCYDFKKDRVDIGP